MNKYHILAFVVHTIHKVILYGNTLCIFFLIYYQPWYIWLPVCTCIISPMLGSSLCVMNRIENHLRVKAGLEPKYFDEVIVQLLHIMYGWKQTRGE